MTQFTLADVNEQLAQKHKHIQLAQMAGFSYYYFKYENGKDSLDQVTAIHDLSDLSLEEWVEAALEYAWKLDLRLEWLRENGVKSV